MISAVLFAASPVSDERREIIDYLYLLWYTFAEIHREGDNMATSKEMHDYIMENLRRAGSAASGKMMGEYLVYFGDRLAGVICDGTLMLKQTEASLRLLPDAEKAYPYDGSKTLMLVVDDYENTELMRKIIEEMYPQLPEKTKKK